MANNIFLLHVKESTTMCFQNRSDSPLLDAPIIDKNAIKFPPGRPPVDKM